MTDFDHYLAREFNYWDEILPAKTNFIVEAGMISKLLARPDNKLSFKQAMAAVHQLVHVDKHYTVMEGPCRL